MNQVNLPVQKFENVQGAHYVPDQFSAHEGFVTEIKPVGRGTKLVAAALAAGTFMLAGCTTTQAEIAGTPDGTEQAAPNQPGSKTEVAKLCAEDVALFANGKNAASVREVITNPDDLYRAPKKKMESVADLGDHFVGNDGVLANSETALGTFSWIAQDLFGQGAANAFTDSTPNDHIDNVDASPDAATKAYANACDVIAYAQPNKDPISGQYFKLVRVETPDGMIHVGVVRVGDLSIGEGDAFRTRGGIITDDTLTVYGDAENEVIIDAESSQVYLKKNIGLPDVTPPDTTTTMPKSGASDQGNNTGKRSGDNGGGGDKGKNQGNGGEGGAAGPNGDNPEAGPGGTTDSPGGPGTTPDTTPGTTPPTRPPTTRPPVTSPPTTRPTTTAPPTTKPPEPRPGGEPN